MVAADMPSAGSSRCMGRENTSTEQVAPTREEFATLLELPQTELDDLRDEADRYRF